jgi:hypothetical protein
MVRVNKNTEGKMTNSDPAVDPVGLLQKARISPGLIYDDEESYL